MINAYPGLKDTTKWVLKSKDTVGFLTYNPETEFVVQVVDEDGAVVWKTAIKAEWIGIAGSNA